MDNMFQSLLKWLQTLNLSASYANAEDLSNGVALAQALNLFAPDVFTDLWLSKIKTDTGTNWRLKMSNIKKVIEGLYDYYGDVLNYSLAEYRRPDAMRIAEMCDIKELERLLQLVLGCAVNCSLKQDYIRQIMCLEEDLQANIMQALQELESTWQGTSMCRNSISIANFDYKILQEERDQLAQKCFETEKKIVLLEEEKGNLRAEVAKLQDDLRRHETVSTIGDDGVSLGPVQVGTVRYNDMRRQLGIIKEELLQSETSREDLRLKCQQQETELQLLQARLEELSKTTAELALLKDEVDFLREANEKLKMCEAQINGYKKKLEDYNDLKKHLKLLEERSADYVQQNVQFEEDVKKCAAIKGQVELYKKEIQELHVKLDQEMSKNVKVEFENKNMECTITALERSKDNLLKERDNLREIIDELKCGQLSTNIDSETLKTMSKELQPTDLLQKLQRLEIDNKILREGQGSHAALVQLLNDANKRNENLREQLKSANERNLAITHSSFSVDANSKCNELAKQLKQLMELNEQKAIHLDEALNQNAVLQTKISQLENSLSGREQELVICDTKFRKCLEKAKEIIKNMDPRSVADMNILEQTQNLDDFQKAKPSMLEENLMTTAFYRICVNAQKDAIDSKLALLMGQRHTFLSRQRQSAPRSVRGK
ncbi:protein hook isoform X1 [Glossina fuscipes]|uniref:Protein hook n=1 Tax=Glossina fuscipes TaxID=7396 RepID=A0A9C6DZH8_9MUSC|nr:protein hook isoform X1 [Glossina fuscipes]XP_037894616.1 protein hook isoform X1 [Glossina fuscipes]XP_037894617.1 protein hook isoform X1 [Glossina fuscipes]XP_037894618.1 protein hook isoform X1 [Glossina fuscipes]XP_037894619.1 protein hook isoform X1 [Glossina fuscipes]XP_037894620.1 protein hook isoform X1 [Glossina fuscipes]